MINRRTFITAFAATLASAALPACGQPPAWIAVDAARKSDLTITLQCDTSIFIEQLDQLLIAVSNSGNTKRLDAMIRNIECEIELAPTNNRTVFQLQFKAGGEFARLIGESA